MWAALRYAAKIVRYAGTAIVYIWNHLASIAGAFVAAVKKGYWATSNFCQKYVWACVAVYNYLSDLFG